MASCSTESQTLLAKGTDATGTGATWTLTTAAACDAAGTTNRYNLGLDRPPAGPPVYLSTTNTAVYPLDPGGTRPFVPLLRMPCTGSSGAGQTMSMQYVFTATIP